MLTALEAGLFLLINKTFFHPAAYLFSVVISELGNGLFLALVSLVLIAFMKKEKKLSGILMLAGLSLTYYVVHTLKELCLRPRPFITFEIANCLLHEESFSFPSGHATAAFMSAFVLSSYFGRRAAFFALASIVALSRVYLGVHYPSDVIFGALIGVTIGFTLTRIAKSLRIKN